MDVTTQTLTDMIDKIPIGHDVTGWVFTMNPKDYHKLKEPSMFNGYDIELTELIAVGNVYLGKSFELNPWQ